MDNDILLDPLTLEVMLDPVISKTCGHSFSNESITQWLNKKQVCPICNTKMAHNDLTPNYSLRDIIKHIEQQKQQSSSSPDESSSRKSIEITINNIQPPTVPLVQPPETIQKPLSSPKPYTIRELCVEDIPEVSVMLERATREDIFMNFFFHDSPRYRISGGTWFINKMLSYALNKARVWVCLENQSDKNKKQIISGVMIAQPPHATGISVAEMFKVGMYLAPFKLGMSVLTRILKSSDFAEKIHINEMNKKGKHWYVNAIAIDHPFRRSQRGSDLLQHVLNLADSQNALCYTECDLPNSNFFRKHDFFMSKFYQQHSNTNEAPHFYTMIRELNGKVDVDQQDK